MGIIFNAIFLQLTKQKCSALETWFTSIQLLNQLSRLTKDMMK